MSTRRLVLQGEQGHATPTGHWLGAEVFHDPDEGFYSARFHARTYEGVQVQSAYTTDEIRLDAENESTAITEAEAQFVEFQKLYETPEV